MTEQTQISTTKYTHTKPKNAYTRVRNEVHENKIEGSRAAAAVNWPKMKKNHIE